MIAVLEGLLFITGEDGITINDIVNNLNVDKASAEALVKELDERLNKEESGLMLKVVGGKYLLTTKPEHLDYYKSFLTNEINNSLSPAALETLAIIAYNQPVTRLEVDELRGVASASLVRKLVNFNLIANAGRAETLGKPFLYKTTDHFLNYFNINSLEELPKLSLPKSEEIDVDLYEIKYQESE